MELDVAAVGATSIDLEVCTNRSARVRTIVSPDPWPADWDATYFESQPGVIEAELTSAGCTAMTHEVTLPEAELHAYAISDVASTREQSQREAIATLRPMLTAVVMSVAAGHTQRYWLHYPESYYRDPTAPLPVLVFMAGQGENGDDAGTGFMTLLNRGMLAPFEQRRDSVVGLPFLVIAPQCNTNRGSCWVGQEANVDEVIEHARQSATFDDDRIYITGLSTGGEGAIRFAMHSRTRPAGTPGVEIAAIVPISSTQSSLAYYMANICDIADVPMWAFHNSDDTTQLPINSERYVMLLNACPPRALAQLDQGMGGHNAWSRVYNDTHTFSNGGMTSMYTWLLAYTR